MSNEKKNFYIGIDLGTTNTVMSFGVENLSNKELQINPVGFSIQDASGGRAKEEVLPSFIYFDEDKKPVIGPRAKKLMEKDGSKVARSVKSIIGENKILNFGGKDYMPEEISGIILAQIAVLAKEKFKVVPEDVIITIPASFDKNQRQATLDAASYAGFKLENSDGSKRDILLSEPRAALYNFVYDWKKGKLPSFELHEPQNILVYDLGGGTLDVSLHELNYSIKNDEVNITDISISRYTKLGGDDFDKVLADYFLEELVEDGLDVDELSEKENEIIEKKLLAISEEVKKDFNQEINDILDYTEDKEEITEEINEIEHEVSKTNIYNDFSLELELTTDKYREKIEPLLCSDITLEELIKDPTLVNDTNIISPMIQVLKDAEKKLGSVPKVSGVLLNGGMSKFYFIRERLEKLFGFEPISETDEDKAVAYGATYYHYQLHNGKKISNSFEKKIGMEIEGELFPLNSNNKNSFEGENIFNLDVRGRSSLEIVFYSWNDKEEKNKKELEKIEIEDEKLLSKELLVKIDVENDKVEITAWNRGHYNDAKKYYLNL